ncbi:hypothetical protein [Nocardioides sp. CER19]|nr:hypothetical protein [Nocardioides sp. CER19]MDH2412918.1 hypothetical protein [Nocardioides sp. CER19]
MRSGTPLTGDTSDADHETLEPWRLAARVSTRSLAVAHYSTTDGSPVE